MVFQLRNHLLPYETPQQQASTCRHVISLFLCSAVLADPTGFHTMGSISPMTKPGFPQDWDAWRDVITQLYQKDGKTLMQVQTELEQKYKVLST